jgi:type II restriction enzyme
LTTERQVTGEFGEKLVTKTFTCPKCKIGNRLQRLPTNFKCADVICDFCGYLAQVKTCTVADIGVPPDNVMGAAWAPQKQRMDAGIYFPLYIVAISKDRKAHAIYYLSADLQDPDIFEPRTPLSSSARRAGWQSFNYRLAHIRDRLVRLTHNV